MKYERHQPLFLGLALASAVFLGGCGSDADPMASDGASVRLSTMVVGADGAALGRAADGEVTIERARLLLRRIVLKDASRQEIDFTSAPRVVELRLDGTLGEIGVQSVPAGRYDEVRFDVHELDDDDPAQRALLQTPEFADFGGRDRASIIVEGTIQVAGEAVAFVYRDDANERQDVSLVPPLVLEGEGAVANVTLRIDPRGWFRDTVGRVLDPRVEDDRDEISDNIRSSIDAVRDDDRDGHVDDDGHDDDDDHGGDDDDGDDDHGGHGGDDDGDDHA